MSVPFDPYHRWLGISPQHQPANHYRLLGLELYENNSDIIRDAGAKQIAHVKMHQRGEHALFAQKLLRELASATICLSDPQRRAKYDAELRGISVQAAAAKAARRSATPVSNAAQIVAPPPPAIPPASSEDSEMRGSVFSSPLKMPPEPPTTLTQQAMAALPRYVPEYVLRLPAWCWVAVGCGLGLLAIGFAWTVLTLTSPPTTFIALDGDDSAWNTVQVEIDGALHPLPTDGRIEFPCTPGTHSLLVTRPGFKAIAHEVRVQAKTREVVPLIWMPEQAIRVLLPPPLRKDVKIAINGTEPVHSRLDGNYLEFPVAPGAHELKLTRSRYQPFQQKLSVAVDEVCTVDPAWDPLRSAGNAVEISPHFHLQRDQVQGEWAIEKEQVQTLADGEHALALPVRVTGDFDLTLEFTRNRGTGHIGVLLPVGERSCALMLSGWNGEASGWHAPPRLDARQDTLSVRPGSLVNDKKYHLEVAVRNEGENCTLLAELDGEFLLSWHGRRDQLSEPLVPLTAPRLLADAPQTVFHKLYVRPVGNGKLEVLSPATAEVPVPQAVPAESPGKQSALGEPGKGNQAPMAGGTAPAEPMPDSGRAPVPGAG